MFSFILFVDSEQGWRLQIHRHLKAWTNLIYRHQSKMSSSKKVYFLEIQSVMFVFSTQLCEMLPL
jgi:hypothetical protein